MLFLSTLSQPKLNNSSSDNPVFLGKGYRFEGNDLILFVNILPAEVTDEYSVFVVETFPQSRLTFRLGCPVILELPSAERLKGFVAGVEGLRACCCQLMLIVVRQGPESDVSFHPSQTFVPKCLFQSYFLE